MVTLVWRGGGGRGGGGTPPSRPPTVAQRPPCGGTKPTVRRRKAHPWWHTAHLAQTDHVVRGCSEWHDKERNSQQETQRGPWVNGPSSDRQRAPRQPSGRAAPMGSSYRRVTLDLNLNLLRCATTLSCSHLPYPGSTLQSSHPDPGNRTWGRRQAHLPLVNIKCGGEHPPNFTVWGSLNVEPASAGRRVHGMGAECCNCEHRDKQWDGPPSHTFPLRGCMRREEGDGGSETQKLFTKNGQLNSSLCKFHLLPL